MFLCPRSRIGFRRVSNSVHSDPIARFEWMAFVANRRPNLMRQNCSFDAPVVLNAMAQSDRKSDGQICGNGIVLAKRSNVAIRKLCKSHNILCAELAKSHMRFVNMYFMHAIHNLKYLNTMEPAAMSYRRIDGK
uniref:Uncharacterized protein n=1 Tax=Ananas comosus var. bracteatus TaxID=296719 RepID=A0A6V7QH03_ANACO|nr:unnamed protein product [Ananas comosus var. bracteatus]